MVIRFTNEEIQGQGTEYWDVLDYMSGNAPGTFEQRPPRDKEACRYPIGEFPEEKEEQAY